MSRTVISERAEVGIPASVGEAQPRLISRCTLSGEQKACQSASGGRLVKYYGASVAAVSAGYVDQNVVVVVALKSI